MDGYKLSFFYILPITMGKQTSDEMLTEFKEEMLERSRKAWEWLKRRDQLNMIWELLNQQYAINKRNLEYWHSVDESEMWAFEEQMMQHYNTSTMIYRSLLETFNHITY